MLTRADCHGVADCLAWLREKERVGAGELELRI
jgi:hypothetical protein